MLTRNNLSLAVLAFSAMSVTTELGAQSSSINVPTVVRLTAPSFCKMTSGDPFVLTGTVLDNDTTYMTKAITLFSLACTNGTQLLKIDVGGQLDVMRTVTGETESIQIANPKVTSNMLPPWCHFSSFYSPSEGAWINLAASFPVASAMTATGGMTNSCTWMADMRVLDDDSDTFYAGETATATITWTATIQ